MQDILNKTSNWKFILPLFLAFVLCIYLFQNAESALTEIAGESMTLIDMKSNYDLAEITEFFNDIGENGRAIHKRITGITDMIFPFVYGPLFILIGAYFMKKITNPQSNWMYLTLFPVLLMIFDYVENFNTLELLKEFPNLTEAMVDNASRVTGIKAALTELSMVFPLLLGVIFVVRRLREKYLNS